jgi:hypothetical protein
MEQNKIDLGQFNEVQLKALAYDELNKLEIAKNNLSILNQELANRQRLQNASQQEKTQ